MPDTRTIAYITSAYARATDTFIRDEVTLLRAAGDRVLTYSVRKPAESEVVNEAVAAERRATTYLLKMPKGAFLAATVGALVVHPRRFSHALAVARALARPGLKGRSWPYLYLLEACVLARELRRQHVEHLHNHIGEGSASVALLASVLTGIPFSFTVHGPSEWDKPTELALDVKARHASFVATISEFTQGQMRRWIDPEDWPKVHIVRCGVGLEFDARVAVVEPEIPTLVSIGRLAKEKGHLVLLEAIQRLGRSVPVRVIIVGDGPERPHLEAFIRRYRLQDQVTLGGWCSTDEVRTIVGASTALVMPSFAEGLPVSIMEAYALGKPVVSSDVGAIAELVRPGISGWLVQPGSSQELTQALRELLDATAPRRRELGARGRAAVRSSHDVRAEVARLHDLIHGA